MFENGNRPRVVIMVPGVFELNMGGQLPRGINSPYKRRAA
jgi:hypothetical protein